MVSEPFLSNPVNLSALSLLLIIVTGYRVRVALSFSDQYRNATLVMSQ